MATEVAKRHQIVGWLALIGLLVLRIPFLGGLRLFGIKNDWVEVVFEIGTYAFTAFLIWWERERLADFHIDALAVAIIVIFKPLSTLILKYWGFDSPMMFPSPFSLVIFAIAFLLAIVVWVQRSKVLPISSAGLRWLLIAMGAGLATSLVLGFPFSFQVPAQALSMWRESLKEVPVNFIYQIGYAGVIEEPVFRGFLWGYLLKLNWGDRRIWLVQAGLFTLAHIYYINTYPISFFVIVPVGALALGYLAWRSRSVATSMVAHGMMNATGFTIGMLIALLRMNVMP